MTTYTIHLTGDRGVIDVDADEVTTRVDGSLWLLTATAKPPAKLSVRLILARSVWTTCYPAGENPLPAESAQGWGGAKAEPKPARELPVPQVADRFRRGG